MKIHSGSIKQFGDRVPKEIPDYLLSERQAQSNHGQTLARLNERGGVCVGEALHLIKCEKLEFRNDDEKDLAELLRILEHPEIAGFYVRGSVLRDMYKNEAAARREKADNIFTKALISKDFAAGFEAAMKLILPGAPGVIYGYMQTIGAQGGQLVTPVFIPLDSRKGCAAS